MPQRRRAAVARGVRSLSACEMCEALSRRLAASTAQAQADRDGCGLQHGRRRRAARRAVSRSRSGTMRGSSSTTRTVLACWATGDDSGRGTLAHVGLESERVVYMGTLGKAAGVSGAFVAAHPLVIDTLLQTARSYVFTTAAPPFIAEALATSVAIIRDDHARRAHLFALVARFRERMRALPWDLARIVHADPADRRGREFGGRRARERAYGAAASGCPRSVPRRCRKVRHVFASRCPPPIAIADVDALVETLTELAPRLPIARGTRAKRGPAGAIQSDERSDAARRCDRRRTAARAAPRMGDAFRLLGPTRRPARRPAIASTRSTCRGMARVLRLSHVHAR